MKIREINIKSYILANKLRYLGLTCPASINFTGMRSYLNLTLTGRMHIRRLGNLTGSPRYLTILPELDKSALS